MHKLKVSVAMMTRNRSALLRLAIESVLAQQGIELELIVLDNASTDDTADVVRSFTDPRVKYIRHPADIGIMRNWNQAIGMAAPRGPFSVIFHDDDIMLDGYLQEVCTKLETNPSAGFSLVRSQFITHQGVPCGVQDLNGLQPGLNSGLAHLELAVEFRGFDIHPPSIAFRSQALLSAGLADSPHMRGTLDLNLYYRIASQWDILVIDKVLVQCRQHGGSDTEKINRVLRATFWYGALAERIDAIARLMRSERAADSEYRNWLSQRLLALHAHQSAAIHPYAPEMYHAWDNRLAMLRDEIERTVPVGETIVLIDDQQLGITKEFFGRRVYPFLQRDGQYWGAPSDAQQAISELKLLREADAAWVVVAWPAFWWLDQYGDFGKHLEQHHRCKLASPHSVIFQLRRST